MDTSSRAALVSPPERVDCSGYTKKGVSSSRPRGCGDVTTAETSRVWTPVTPRAEVVAVDVAVVVWLVDMVGCSDGTNVGDGVGGQALQRTGQYAAALTQFSSGVSSQRAGSRTPLHMGTVGAAVGATVGPHAPQSAGHVTLLTIAVQSTPCGSPHTSGSSLPAHDRTDGAAEGAPEVGAPVVGTGDGRLVLGAGVGRGDVGASVGAAVGAAVVGAGVGAGVGSTVGAGVGTAVGPGVRYEGVSDGSETVGAAEGMWVTQLAQRTAQSARASPAQRRSGA